MHLLRLVATPHFNFLPHAISILNRKLHLVRFYLGYWNQPWFGPAGSENACIFCMRKQFVATQLYLLYLTVKKFGNIAHHDIEVKIKIVQTFKELVCYFFISSLDFTGIEKLTFFPFGRHCIFLALIEIWKSDKTIFVIFRFLIPWLLLNTASDHFLGWTMIRQNAVG
jgi:hypothetical protein